MSLLTQHQKKSHSHVKIYLMLLSDMVWESNNNNKNISEVSQTSMNTKFEIKMLSITTVTTWSEKI